MLLLLISGSGVVEDTFPVSVGVPLRPLGMPRPNRSVKKMEPWEMFCVLFRCGVFMNHPFQLLTVSLLFTSVGFCQTSQETTILQHQRFETNLASGANLRLHLHDGNFRILGSDSEKISVHVEGKNVEQAKNIKIQLNRSDG